MRALEALLRWPLGGFLVASALAHAALFGFPLDLTPGSRMPQAPVVVTLLPGQGRAGRQSRPAPQRVAPVPRRTVRHPVPKSQPVRSKPAPKSKPAAKPAPKPAPKPTLKPADKTPPLPAPATLVQRPPPPAAEEAPPAPAAAVVAPEPDAAAPPGDARPEVTPIAVDKPPQNPAGNPGAVSGGEPLTADFGTANGPRILQLEQPVYPPRALRLRREGKVLLRLAIDSSGHLQSATVVESAGYGFDASALAAVRRARFAPAIRNGRPVPCVALLPVSFTLSTRP